MEKIFKRLRTVLSLTGFITMSYVIAYKLIFLVFPYKDYSFANIFLSFFIMLFIWIGICIVLLIIEFIITTIMWILTGKFDYGKLIDCISSFLSKFLFKDTKSEEKKEE